MRDLARAKGASEAEIDAANTGRHDAPCPTCGEPYGQHDILTCPRDITRRASARRPTAPAAPGRARQEGGTHD
jgi:hypothetical protein